MKLLGVQAHLEPCRDWDALVLYCQKTSSRLEGGPTFSWGNTTASQGRRSDLEDPVAAVMSGHRMGEVAGLYPLAYTRYCRGLEALAARVATPVCKFKRVALFWGETGTGKTRTVFEACDVCDLFMVPDTRIPWFTGYDQQKVALMDEMGIANVMNINLLKRVLDRYGMWVPTKGGQSAWNPDVIIMTSNTPYWSWFDHGSPPDIEALKRRMTLFEFPKEAEAAKQWLADAMVWCGLKQEQALLPVLAAEPSVDVTVDLGWDAVWGDRDGL